MHPDILDLVHQKIQNLNASVGCIKILSHFGCIENSIFIFMAFFWKTVEVWEYSFRPFQNSCKNSSQPWQELISLFKQKIGISKDIFHTKRAQEVDPWKIRPPQSNVIQSLEQERGTKLNFFWHFEAFFPTNIPGLPIIKPGAKKGIYCENRQKISALGRRFEVSEHLQVIFRNLVNKPTGTLKTKLLFWRPPNYPMLVKTPRKDS